MLDTFASRGDIHPSLSTLSTSIAHTERDYTIRPNIARLLCASSGGCMLEVEGKSVHLIGARMALLTGTITYRLTKPSSDFALTSIDITMEPGRLCDFGLKELASAFPALQRITNEVRSCIVFYDNFAMVMTALQSIHTFSMYDTPERDMQISLTLSFLLAAVATSAWDEDLQGMQYSKHVRAALKYIHENYMCNITTTEIAAAAGVHIGHLHRVFLAETGSNIGEYVTHVRIEKAKSLLMRTDIPTRAVANRVGVSTLQYFSRLFKRQVGVTPQAFRRSYDLTCDYGPSMQFLTADKGWEVGKDELVF